MKAESRRASSLARLERLQSIVESMRDSSSYEDLVSVLREQCVTPHRCPILVSSAAEEESCSTLSHTLAAFT